MRRIAMILIGAVLLQFSTPSPIRCQDSQESLRTQIILYNLVGGLYLTEEQKETILGEARKLESLRGQMQIHSSAQSQALLALREEVKREVPQVPQDLAQEIHQSKQQSLRLRKGYYDELQEATQKIKDGLTDAQVYLISTFKPCLVPPKGPARIGQALLSTGGIHLLERLRAMPEEGYRMRKHKISDKFIEKVSLRYPQLTEQELSEARNDFLRIIEEVRGLSSVDFAVKKETKAEEIKNLIEPRKEVDVDKKIAYFLLSPQIIPILEERN
ncbi:MAG: hypothetical protein JSW40_00290 [Candidatus Omnitrophota bacterium]|nr:MAG: hypothetical protein JSW40_00290 [Candidatus Omnitrophota bacterium]